MDNKPKSPFLQFLTEVLVNVVVIVILFLIIQKFVVAPFQVIGSSMVNTLHDREYILVSKLEYIFGDPKRGDIIVFNPPTNEKDYYVKRIIGIPGDTVSFVKGKVFVNNEAIVEQYTFDGGPTCLVPRMASCPGDNKAFIVPDGEYFVLGDNREGSSDSRSWRDASNQEIPFVKREEIAGKARIVLLPFNAIRVLPEAEIKI